MFESWDVVMSISAEDTKQFLTHPLNYQSLGHETWPIDRYGHGQYF